MKKNIILMYSNHKPSAGHIRRLKKVASGYNVVVANSETGAIKAAKDAYIILGHRYLRQCLPYSPNLRWVQTTGGGFDNLPFKGLKQKDILLTRSTIPSYVIARHAYTLAWALIRRLPRCFSLQMKRQWNPAIDLLPMPRAALILGFGSIGKEIAKLLRQDGIKVLAVKRKLDDTSRKLCDKLLAISSWRSILPQIDLCFLCTPLNKATKNMFNGSALKALPKHAIVINVGRGATLDTKTVIHLLKKGSLGGAGLDVLEKQPPKANDLIWQTPNLIITPYIAARYPERAEQIERYFESQLKRYIANKPLENIIDWKKVKKDYEC